MSIFKRQLLDVVFYSVDKREFCTNSSQIVNHIELNTPAACLHKKVAEKISQAIISLQEEYKTFDLYNVEQEEKDNSGFKVELVAACVEATRFLYPCKGEEEVVVEINQILSIVQANMCMAKKAVVNLSEIESTLARGLGQILIKALSKTAPAFERDYLFLDEIITDIQVKRSKQFSCEICSAFADACILAIDFKHTKLYEKIELFIKKNGIVTIGVCLEFIKTDLMHFYRELSETNNLIEILERYFFEVFNNNKVLSDSAAIAISNLNSKLEVDLKDFIAWGLQEVLGVDKQETGIPYLINSNRIYLFSLIFIKDKSVFYVCGECFNDKIEEFIKENTYVEQRFVKYLQDKIYDKDSVIAEVLPMIITAIFYYNAILNGRVNKEIFQKMKHFEILHELSKDLLTIQNREIFKKQHKTLFKSVSQALFMSKRFPWGLFHEDQKQNITLEVDNVFNLTFDDPTLEDEFVIVLEQISNFIVEQNINKINSAEILPSDKDLSMMLLSAVEKKAEEFIISNYSVVEKEFLEQQCGSSKILKLDKMLIHFLITIFMSKLAKTIYKNKFGDNPSGIVALNLKQTFQDFLILNDIIPIDETNILDKIQDYIFYSREYSKLILFSEEEKDWFVRNLLARVSSCLKDNTLECRERALCEGLSLMYGCVKSVNLLIITFFEYLFTDFIKKRNQYMISIGEGDFYSKIDTYLDTLKIIGVPLLRLKAYYVITKPLLSLMRKEFLQEFKSLSEGYLLLRSCEFKDFAKLVQNRRDPKMAIGYKYDTKEAVNVVFNYGVADKITVVICSIMLMVWAKHQGLAQLEEKQKFFPREILLEALSDRYIEEALVELYSLIFTLSNRSLFSIGTKLANYQDEEKYEFEFVCLHFADNLTKQKKGDKYFKAICKGLESFLKKTNEKEKDEIIKHAIKEYSIKEEKTSLEQKKSNRTTNKKTSKAERSRQHRLDMQKKKKDLKEKQELEIKEQEREDSLSIEECKNDINTFKGLEKKHSIDSSSEFDNTFCESSEEDSDIKRDEAQEELLEGKTLEEVVYNAQALAIEALDLEFEGLSDRERELLLRFADKMKSSVVERAYKQGAIDNEKKRKERKYVKSWGEEYKVEDIDATQGASSPMELFYIIIQPKSFIKWLEKRNPKTQEEIIKRFTKIVSEGDFGDKKSLHSKAQGAFELKFHDPCATRIYYVPKGKNIYILCGGDKSDQGKTISNRLPLLVEELKSKRDF